MYHFENDYNAMSHPKVMEALLASADLRMTGYGADPICKRAADLICKLCENDDISVHFLTGGTQVNLTVISSVLRPYQAVIAADSGHINEHESGAIEATGHKVLLTPSEDGKITAEQIHKILNAHYMPNCLPPEHLAQPKMVCISFSTEMGTIYYKKELEAIRSVCDHFGAYLYIDGARLGYGLCAADCDVTLADIARLSDVFYMGGTKQGLLFGEAVVIPNASLAKDFRYMIKQRGGMLAKGWLIGLQFQSLLEDGLYFSLAQQANVLADNLRLYFKENHIHCSSNSRTNQVFTVLPDRVLDALSEKFLFSDWMRIDSEHRMVRFCTSWSTSQADVDALIDSLNQLLGD